MRKKKALLMSLVTLLFFSIAIVRVGANGLAIVPVDAPDPTSVSVEPANVTVDAPGLNCTVKVWVRNVTWLYGYDFKLYWDSTILDLIYIDITRPAVWGANYFIAKNDTSVPGRYWHALSAWAPAPPFNGSTSLVTLVFNATAAGTSVLNLDETKLADSIEGNPIAHTTNDGQVTVLPEFSASLIMALFMVATLAAVVLGKKVWPRKRRIPFVAE